MIKRSIIPWLAALCLAFALHSTAFGQPKKSQVLIKFRHEANGKTLVMQDSAYQSAFGEAYQLTKLKYYVSDLKLHKPKTAHTEKSIYLIDIAGQDSVLMDVAPGTYKALTFTLGVDSLFNCSGAQEGPLDPLNGMFWSWNSGYVFFKMEGYSSSSTADLQRIEQHIGGYLGSHKASADIVLPLQEPLIVEASGMKTIAITMDLDKYWKGKNEIRIASTALIMVPGALAIKSAQNFPGMFSIKGVK